MWIEASRWKYLAFVLGLGACFFDPKATGPGTAVNPSNSLDGSAPLLDGASGTGSSGTSGGQSGDGIGTGVGAMSGGGAGTGGPASTSGTGGASADGGTPPPPLLENGNACTEDARCTSGHCDVVCCDKGSECCKTVGDCTTTGGLGMSCDDRSMCRGSAGKITCTSEFKCVTVNGARNDTACSNRVEASDCGLYPSVFCLGGELQQGAPACATSCASDTDCDTDAHCNSGQCETDKPNGEKCTRPEDCTAGFCKNVVNGAGVCCGLVGDCCLTADDCPDTYRQAQMCTDQQACRGFETQAVCIANICSSMMVPADGACNGKPGPTCGLYQDVTCMAGRSNACRTSCTMNAQCDANAYCDGSKCQEKKPVGGVCATLMECQSGNCNNGVCCGQGLECCSTEAQCTMGLDLKCDTQDACQGTRKSPTCQNSHCMYGNRLEDDSACKGAARCGAFKDVTCTGMPDQNNCTMIPCTTNDECDSNAQCMRSNGVGTCVVGGGGAAGGNQGPAGAGGGP
jgi:hypothetical protein